MRLDTIFPKRVITAAPDCHLGEIAVLMEEHEVGTVVIVERDRPVGVMTDRDLAIELGSGRAARSEPIRVIMSSPVATIGCHEGILNATWRMHDGDRVQIGNLRVDTVEDNPVRLEGSGNRLDLFSLRCVRFNTRGNGAAAIHLAEARRLQTKI